MTNKPISFKEAYMTTIKKSGSAHNLTAQQPTGCVLKTLPVYHKEIDYPRSPVKGGRISITTVLGRICITLSFLAFIGSAGRVDTDPHISIATLGLMLVFSASLAGIGAMLINWRKFS